MNSSLVPKLFPKLRPEIGPLADLLRNDVGSACQRIFRRRNSLFRINIIFGYLQRVAGCQFLRQHDFSKGLQPSFFGNLCPCPFLGLIRKIEVFQFLQLQNPSNRRFQFRRQFTLLSNTGQNLLLSFIKRTQIAQPLINKPHFFIVKFAGCLFSVPGDKRNRIPFIQQPGRRLDLSGLNAQFLCNMRKHFHGHA